jgi:hypothetical protein
MTILLWARLGFLILFGVVVTLYACTAYYTRGE